MDNKSKIVEDDSKKAENVLNFFEMAFCAEKAEFATSDEQASLTPSHAIKITSGDSRGVFYIAKMEDTSPCK